MLSNCLQQPITLIILFAPIIRLMSRVIAKLLMLMRQPVEQADTQCHISALHCHVEATISLLDLSRG